LTNVPLYKQTKRRKADHHENEKKENHQSNPTGSWNTYPAFAQIARRRPAIRHPVERSLEIFHWRPGRMEIAPIQ
jgi:hypothetical protein